VPENRTQNSMSRSREIRDKKMAFTGTYKLQKTEFYNEYLKALNVGWFQRRAACSNNRSITVTEGAQGTINL
jgi:hypothetical protein